MAYRLYTGKFSKCSKHVFASISKDRRLRFSEMAVRKFKLYPGETIRVFFNKERGLLGVELYYKDGVENIVRIDKHYRVCFLGCIKEFRLKFRKITGRHPMFQAEDSGIISIDLKRRIKK